MNSCTISESSGLVKVMARKARALQKVIFEVFEEDNGININSEFRSLVEEFQKESGTEATTKAFSDFCAQLIVFGLFVELTKNESVKFTDCRKSEMRLFDFYPFGKRIFNFIFKDEADKRIKSAVDDIIDMFLQVDKESVLEDLNRKCSHGDPVFDLYEIFLSEYDGKARKAEGVWYTPQPAVDFITRAVDEILRTEFHAEDGLADTSKTNSGKPRLQIIDPALGNGAFLVGVINRIYEKHRNKNPEKWDSDVSDNLLQKISGLEMSMIPYALAHLRIGETIRKTGYKSELKDKMRIFCVNSLEYEVSDGV